MYIIKVIIITILVTATTQNYLYLNKNDDSDYGNIFSRKWNPWLTEMPQYNMGVFGRELIMYCTNCAAKTDVQTANYSRVLPLIRIV
jgi:hypothetical protein